MIFIKGLKMRFKSVFALGVLTAIFLLQLAEPAFAATAAKNAANDAALSHLEKLYRAYIEEYGDKTTATGLRRIYDSGFEINSDSFAAEKAAGYEVELEATVLRPTDGANDSDGEIVSGHSGFVTVKAILKKNSEEAGNISFSVELKPQVKTLSYTKSTEQEDSTVWDIGSGKYLNYYRGDADKLVIPEGVEEINSKTLGEWYTGDKTKVKIIIYPSTMKKIMPYTMQGFTNLTAVYIPDGCTEIGENAFDGCTSLRYVRLPEGVSKIPDKCFRNTPALTQLYFPSTLAEVGDYAFNGSAVRDMVITADNFVGNGYDTHKNYVITLNAGINSEIKDDVAGDLTDDMGYISCRNFYYLGTNPTVKSSWLWYSCDIANGGDYLWYTYIYALEGNSIEEFIATQTSNSLEDEYTSLDSNTAEMLRQQHFGLSGEVFEDEDVLSHLEKLYRAYIEEYGDKTTAAGLRRIYDSGFEINSDSFAAEKAAGYEVDLKAYVLRPVDGSCDADGFITPARDGYVCIDASVSKSGKEIGKVELTLLIKADEKKLSYTKSTEQEDSTVWDIGSGKYLNYYRGDADKLVIPEGVEEINSKTLGEWYTGDKTKVKIIIYPSTMKKIMPYTMQGFTNLTAVYIPDGCTEIGENAFDGCTSLRYVRLPEGVSKIPDKCFRNTPALTQLYFPSTLAEVGDYAFNGSAVRDMVITADNFVGNGYDTHKNYVITLNAGINSEIKDDVAGDLTDDMGYISCRNFYYLGTNPTVKSSWLWYSCDIANGGDYLWYTYIYALEGNSIEEFIATQTSNSLEDEYTPLDNNTAAKIGLLHDENMKFGRYPIEMDTEDLQGIIDTFTFENNTTEAEFSYFLRNELSDKGYEAVVEDWYKLRAVPGCSDQDGMMFEGYKGYISASVELISVNGSEKISVYGVIEPEIYKYSFDSVAKADEFYPETVDGIDGLRGDTGTEGEFFLLSQDGKILIDYFGSAEKIIIPEGVEYLDQSWWLDTDLTAVRCIILPNSLKSLPDQFAVPFSSSVEVIIMGDNVTTAEGKHSFWKCYRLKNLRLSEKLENLNEEAFFETLVLTDLRLPASLKTISQGAFHLSAIRDIVVPADVEFIASEAFAWPLRTLSYLEEGVRTQGNAIPVEISKELEPFLQEKICLSKGVYVPRTITVMSEDVAYGDTANFWNTDLSWIPVKVNYIDGSTTEELIKSGYASDKDKYSYGIINMSETECKVNLMAALESLPVDSGITPEKISAYLDSFVVSDLISGNVEISGFSLIPPENGNDGKVSAVVSVDFKSGSTIKLGLDRTVSYIKEYSVDMNKGGWTGEEFAYDNKFSPNITRFEDETVTEYVEVPVEIKTEKQDDANETVTTTTTIIKKVKKNKTGNNGNLTSIVLISVIAAVVVASGIAAFAVIRKKKKNVA